MKEKCGGLQLRRVIRNTRHSGLVPQGVGDAVQMVQAQQHKDLSIEKVVSQL